ncbi:hypothetical protein [Streptomyces lateritius]|uniref:hypothetical protein n=1 Tax=Streptomyces lateritius TaxID=67313 RepID=UPI0019C3803C|nr:hypothetical protein GCM10010272_34830 [Streptomyces lateritius]
MDVFCGIDWAEEHHGVATIDNTGKQLATCRSNDDLNGYEVLLDLLAEPATPLRYRPPSRSRTAAASWSPPCGPASGTSSRSTRWRPRAIATGTGEQTLTAALDNPDGDALFRRQGARADAEAERRMAAERKARRPVCWRCGTTFTDERREESTARDV